MRVQVKFYVLAVAVCAVVASGAVYLLAPLNAQSMLGDALFLCGLAIAGEMLAFALPNRAIGSIGFIPYFAAAVLVPSWPSVFSVALVRTALELRSDRQWIKRILNISAHTLTESVAILIYVGLGGVSVLQLGSKVGLTFVTRHDGLPAIIAFTLAFFFNNFTVLVAIALAGGRSIPAVLIEGSRSTFVIDFLTSPLVFVFAWVYADFGPIAAAALWVPILGLRHVHQANLELERTNEELLELMVKSLEARDPYTSGHSRRVHQYSMTIARAIGLGDQQAALVGRAALLHDVGKIYEKYAPVLAKQDKLTPEEWAVIQDHPADGANLVATMTRLRDIVPAIRGHHENWDGTGYPDGLAGDLIPLPSRIIRFADTIDAMTTERPYRKPLTEGQVRAEVVRCRGSQFDPDITDQLLSSALWSALFVPGPGERPSAPLSVVGTFARRRMSARMAKGA